MIELAGVEFAYPGGARALRGVDLRLEAGCACLLGHNGAGKSTLLRHLNGLLRPTRGRVSIAGRDIASAPPGVLSRSVALAFQNPSVQLFKETILEEVRFGAENGASGSASPEERTRWAIGAMGLAAVAERNPYEVQLGTRKRVAVASIVAMDTPVVVLDEPTAGQDAEGVTLFDRLVETLLERDKLVIIATHDVELARRHADRVVLLAAGAVVRQGTPAEVFGDAQALARAGVEAPAVTRLAAALGAPAAILDDDALIDWLRGAGQPA